MTNVKKACKKEYVNGDSKYNTICIMSSEKESRVPLCTCRKSLVSNLQSVGAHVTQVHAIEMHSMCLVPISFTSYFPWESWTHCSSVPWIASPTLRWGEKSQVVYVMATFINKQTLTLNQKTDVLYQKPLILMFGSFSSKTVLNTMSTLAVMSSRGFKTRTIL